jgi:hypothetical protein
MGFFVLIEKIGMGAGRICKCAGFVAAASLILTLLSPLARAETNDNEFNGCLHFFLLHPHGVVNEPWHSSRLPEHIEKIVRANLYGDFIVRWTDHKNQNGTITYAVLTRDPTDPVGLADDTDLFEIILEQGSLASIKDYVSMDGFAFSTTQKDGINGLLFCIDQGSSPVWSWTGSDWSAP